MKRAALPILLPVVLLAACAESPTGITPGQAPHTVRRALDPSAVGKTKTAAGNSATAGGPRMDDNGFGAGSGYNFTPPPPPVP